MRKFYPTKIEERLRECAFFAVIGLGILALAGAVKEVRAQENLKYEITKIVIPDPNANFSEATCVNEYGEIVGFYGKKDSQYRKLWRKSFLYKNGTVRDLGYSALDINPSGIYCNRSINDLGDIVVCSITMFKSFVYKIGEEPTELAFWGEDINNKGEVVGGIGNEIYLYSEGKTITLFHSGDGVETHAVNEYTQVVGSVYGFIGFPHAFLWENGTRTDLPGGFGGALDINNKSQIAGYFIKLISGNPATNFACLWEKDSQNKWVVRQLDTAVNSRANAINDKGQIVGSETSLGWSYTPTKATLYEIRNGELIKVILNDFLPENSEWERLVCALDINDKGQIVGYGEGRNEPGSQYAFVMTPIPQPSADLYKDGIVDFKDLAEFASQWLESNQR